MRRLTLIVAGLVCVAALSACDDLKSVARKAKNQVAGEALAAPKTPPARTQKVAGSPLAVGINLAAVQDWSPAWVFVDIFKASRPWISGNESKWSDDRSIDVDDRGWVRSLQPGQIARTLMFTDVKNYPKGRYTVRYQGKGKLDYSFPLVESREGRDIIDVDPARGHIILNLVATDAADPIRNIEVLVPPHCQGDVCTDFTAQQKPPLLHPQFLADHQGFAAVRFMDWMQTNDAKVGSWAQRPRPDDARYTQKGIPIEVIVEVAEVMNADPWINVPHLADDDYVKELATYLRDHVQKDRRIYVELSNELWNGIFPQSRDFEDKGVKRKLKGGPFEQKLRFASERAVAVMKIFEAVFGSTERLVRVMGSQAVNPWVSEVQLSHDKAWEHIDALAIAPYIGGDFGLVETAQKTLQEKTAAGLIEEMKTKDAAKIKAWVQEQKKVADRYGVHLLGYEGGQHMTAHGPYEDSEPLNALFDEVNRAPAMKDVYLAYLRAWKEGGGELFVHFNDCDRFSKWGRWGAREYAGQKRTEAPKLDALLTFNEQNPRWWQ